MSNAKNIIKKEKKAAAPFSFEFSKVTFASQPKDSFRVKASTAKDGVLLWIESKKSKRQWQATITDVSECGPPGIPEGAVFAFLKRAFELVETGERGSEDPEADLEPSDTEMVLTLTLSMGGIWRPEFAFVLLPVGLEKVDMLEAKLRDAQEEIQSLRKGSLNLLALTSKTACGHNQIVVWDGEVVPMARGNSCQLSVDKRQVTFQIAGVYEIKIRLAGTSTGNTHSTGLQLNGADVAICIHADGSGYQHSAHISAILEIKVGDILQVRCGFVCNSLANALANCFNIVRLGD